MQIDRMAERLVTMTCTNHQGAGAAPNWQAPIAQQGTENWWWGWCQAKAGANERGHAQSDQGAGPAVGSQGRSALIAGQT